MKAPDGWSSTSASRNLDTTMHVGAPWGAFLSSGRLTWKETGTGSSSYIWMD